MARTLCFHCQNPGSIHDQETKISQAVRHSQKKLKTRIFPVSVYE